MTPVDHQPTVWRWFVQWRFVQLTAVTIVYMLIAPWLASLSLLRVIAQFVLFTTLLVTISATTGHKFSRRIRKVAWGLFSLSFSIALAGFLPIDESWQRLLWYVELVVSMLLLGGCAAGILAFIARPGRVTIDKIFAAVVAYILIAVAFAMIYLAIWDLNPAAFNLPLDQSASTDDARLTMIYFSFVTMATLGYGDILAVDPFARMVASIEAITGQFYVAILVGVLVGLYISHNTRNRPAGR